MNDLDDAWKTYRLKVVPLDASSYQATETRRAYFAGAGAVVRLLQALQIEGAPRLDRELDALRLEVERFRAEVTAGRA
jgi:hypothetical protein